MCLSIPAKITEIKTGESPLMGIVDFGGVSREICLDYVPEAEVARRRAAGEGSLHYWETKGY